MKTYTPKKGDFVSIYFEGTHGHEQKGRRPALVVSNSLFNEHSGLVFVCPITNTNRGYPFHLPIPKNNRVEGVVMVDQIKSIDYKARKLKFLAKAPENTLKDTLSLIDAIIN